MRTSQIMMRRSLAPGLITLQDDVYNLQQRITQPGLAGNVPPPPVIEGADIDNITIGGVEFNTNPPGVAEGVTITTGSFFDQIFADVEWTAAAVDDDADIGESTNWTIMLAKGDAPNNYEFIGMWTPAGTSYRLDNLEPNTDYVVKIQARSPLGLFGDETEWIPFSTGQDTTVPAAPVGLVMYGGAASVILRWTDNAEADVTLGRGLYELQLDTSNQFNSANFQRQRISGNVAVFGGLNAQQVWYGRVAAIDTSGNQGAWSPIANTVGGGVLGGWLVAQTVLNAALATNAVDQRALAALAVTSTHITDNAVTTPKILANAVVAGHIAADQITSWHIATNTITTNEIAAGQITSALIAARTIVGDDIAFGTLTGYEIAANTLTASHIQTNSLTADRLTTSSLTAATIRLNGGSITVGAIPTLAGMVINSQGIRAYASGGQTFAIDSSGSCSFTGAIQASYITSSVFNWGGGLLDDVGGLSFQMSGGGWDPKFAISFNTGASRQWAIWAPNSSSMYIQKTTSNQGAIYIYHDAIYMRGYNGGNIARFYYGGSGLDNGLDVYGWLTAGGVSGAVKNFIIDHPLDPDNKHLQHSVLESPDIAVFYRGEGRLVRGKVVVTLPDYFEALTHTEDRTVLLTPIDEPEMLAASRVVGGQFTVFGKKDCSFWWEVKAVRKDVERLVVEYDKHELAEAHEWMLAVARRESDGIDPLQVVVDEQRGSPDNDLMTLEEYVSAAPRN